MFTQHVVSEEGTAIVVVKPHDSHLSTWSIDDYEAQDVVVGVDNMVGVQDGSASVAFVDEVEGLLRMVVVGGGGMEAHPRHIGYVVQLACEHYSVDRKRKINAERSSISSRI